MAPLSVTVEAAELVKVLPAKPLNDNAPLTDTVVPKENAVAAAVLVTVPCSAEPVPNDTGAPLLVNDDVLALIVAPTKVRPFVVLPDTATVPLQLRDGMLNAPALTTADRVAEADGPTTHIYTSTSTPTHTRTVT
jgi:hypothetical protein